MLFGIGLKNRLYPSILFAQITFYSQYSFFSKMSNILKDSRFTKLLNDPKYRQIPKHQRKIKIDKRFKSMFNDDKFKVKYSVDKRGRPVNETSSENLRRYYDLNSDESENSDSEHISESEESPNDEAKKPGTFLKIIHKDSTDDKNLSEPLKNDKLVRGKLDSCITAKLHDLEVDYARGEGFLQTDSSSDDESSDKTEESDLEHEWGELDADAETTDTSTSRLAVCNMDWDNIKAVDIMVLFNSFLPPGCTIHKISIYPSEYGKQRMQEEEVRGPIELTEHKKNSDKFDDRNDDVNEEGSSYHMEKLRRYQLNRLKYYYAVVECDKVSTADKLYSECDRMEYESSATKLDLRFIPDDVSFDEESKDVCEKMPDFARYKPRLFTTTALQQAKVELTWDTTNPNRKELIKNALEGDVNDADLKDYLASSSDESDDVHSNHEHKDEEDVNDDPIKKYKNLLKDIDEKEEKKKYFDMELTWDLGVKEKAEELVQKKITQGATELTPFEKLIEKRKEKKKTKKLQRLEKIKSSDQSADNLDSGTSEDDDIPSDVDMTDPYFAEEFNKPEFKKKKNRESRNQSGDQSADEETLKENATLQLLLDDEDDGKAHFSLKKIQDTENANSKKSHRKKKLIEKINENKMAVPNFEINVDDQRFSALFNSHHYNIDPTDPNFKKTKNMEKLIQEKLKRRSTEFGADEVPLSKKLKDAAKLSVVIKNIKRKTKGANIL